MNNRVKKLILLCLSVVMTVTVLSGCGQKEIANDSGVISSDNNMLSAPVPINADYAEKKYVCIEFEKYDPIYVELEPYEAPITVENFLKLVNEKFYDGLTFHRIMPGFMIQGGDPSGSGKGGTPEKIKGEFMQNGVRNNITHERGVISMARSQMPDSASSQFFIVHKDSPFLDGNYAGFGHVLKGMETVDAICNDTPTQDSNGTVLAEDQPVIKTIREITKEEIPE